MKKNWLQRILSSDRDSDITGGNVAHRTPSPEVMEKVLLTGDLASLTPEQRLSYYESVCRALKLNPLTKPFEYITLNGKLTLYTRRDCTDQLRKIYGISIKILSREVTNNVIVVSVRAMMPSGREDESLGCVSATYPAKIKGFNGQWTVHPKAEKPLEGDDRANAMMKCETKAKRRVTLSICGLGMFDESELDSISNGGNQMTPEDRVRQATENATSVRAVEVRSEPVTEENYNDVVCHIGKAEGNMLGKPIRDIHVNVLQWLKDHYGEGEGIRWGNPPDEKDERLKQAVDLALKKLSE